MERREGCSLPQVSGVLNRFQPIRDQTDAKQNQESMIKVFVWDLLNDGAGVSRGVLNENRHSMCTKREKLVRFRCSVRIRIVKTWSFDVSDLRNVQIELSEVLPQG